MTRRVALLVLALLAAPAAASSGAWSATAFFPIQDHGGIYVAGGDVATNGGRPAGLVLDGWGDRVLYAQDPMGGSGWRQVPMTVAPAGEPTMRLVLAADGKPHLFVHRASGDTSGFSYATTTGPWWLVEPIHWGPSQPPFRLHGAALDAAGQPSALVTAGTVDGLYTRTAAGWAFRPLGAGTGAGHLAASPTGLLHACLVTADGVVHAKGTAAGVWATEVAWPVPLETSACSIAAPTDADVRIAFDAEPGVLRHAQRTPSGWSVSVVPVPVNASATTRVGVAAGGASYVVVQPGGGARLFAQDAAGAWAEETLPGLADHRTRPTMAPGPVKPYVGTADGGLHVWSWS